MSIFSDLRFGARMILKRPGTSALAIIALALGIGLTTTMFSIVQGAFLRGLPFPESDRIYHLGRLSKLQNNGNGQSLPLHDFVDWKTSQRSFEELGAFAGRQVNVTGGVAPARYSGARVTPNMLRILRVAPAAGRDFAESDAAPGAPPVAILSDQAWASQFERDPAVIGHVVRLNGIPTTIIGIMPPRFGFPQRQDVWMPLTLTLTPKRGAGDYVQVFARLKRGVTFEQAEADLSGIAGQLAVAYPENKDLSVRIVPYIRRFIGNDPIRTLSVMLAAVFGVLLIACANVANLQLARAAERTKEVAVRTALGASRGRIIRQHLLEGALLASAGMALGLGLAAIGVDLFMRAIVDTTPPFWIDIKIDATVLLFASGLAVIAALAASLVPALRTTRQDVHSVLKDEGRANTGLHMGRFGRSLVVAEVLLSCTLLIVSGLMIKSVVLTGQVTYPYPTEDVFIANITGDETKYSTEADRTRLLERLETTLQAIPGIRSVALATGTPENSGSSSFVIEGQPFAKPEDQPSTRILDVSARFFDVLRVKVQRGRGFTPGDVLGAPRVALVSEDFVRRHFANGDALDKRIRFGSDPQAPWWTIVGVAPRLVSSRTTDDASMVYRPLAQVPTRSPGILATASGDPLALVGPIRRVLQSIDEDLPLAQPTTLARSYYRQAWATRVFGTLFASFGFTSLILAAAGLYGVMAFSVRRRTPEIGVRMALGADRAGVVRMILWQGMWRVMLGVALGLVPAWFLGGAMRSLLFNVARGDVTVYAVTIGCLLTAGFVASVIPALRAASVDPLKALRHD